MTPRREEQATHESFRGPAKVEKLTVSAREKTTCDAEEPEPWADESFVSQLSALLLMGRGEDGGGGECRAGVDLACVQLDRRGNNGPCTLEQDYSNEDESA